jgi:hypothetical protein
MDKLELVFKVEKDTKNTRRYQEEASDGPPTIGTLSVSSRKAALCLGTLPCKNTC